MIARALSAAVVLAVTLLASGAPAHAEPFHQRAPVQTWPSGHEAPFGRWDTTTVHLVDTTPASAWPLATAAALWNSRRAGQPHLTVTRTCPPAAACVTVRQTKPTWYAGEYVPEGTSHGRLLVLQGGTVHLATDIPPGCRLHVAVHEFGHVLGLDHATSATSGAPDVMSPDVAVAECTGRLQGPITPADLGILRGLYVQPP